MGKMSVVDIKELSPLVSVIIPVYKVEEYLNRCVQSVMNQTYRNIEIILVDDGSPDNCGALCDEYKKTDGRIRVIHKENGGLSSARNAGLDIAMGEYVFFVDSDDWITLDMIHYMLDLGREYLADIVSISYVLTEQENPKIEDSNFLTTMSREQAMEYFFDIGMKSRVSEYPVCIKMFKRELFDTVRFPLDTLYEDYTTNVELIKKCNVYVKSSKICYFYFQGGRSIVRSCYKKKDNQLLSQCEKVCEMVCNESESIRVKAKEKLARSYYSLLIKIVVYGFDRSIEKEERKIIINNLQSNLRSNLGVVLRSKMNVGRKIVALILCFKCFPILLLRKVLK